MFGLHQVLREKSLFSHTSYWHTAYLLFGAGAEQMAYNGLLEFFLWKQLSGATEKDA